jgi:hypothetical protein
MSQDEKFSPTGAAADLVKKILTVGIGAVFLTPDAVKGLISEFKLPKELLNGVLESANKTKNEFFTRLSNDIMEKFSEKVDPKALMESLLHEHEIELKISFKRKKTDV